MSAKKRKNISPWLVCDNCNVIIALKDSLIHNEKSCPPSRQTWVHSFIKDSQLHTNVELFDLHDKNLERIPKESRNDVVLLPYYVLQLCKIPIGDPIVIEPCDSSHNIPFVKMAWPLQEKISDFSLSVSKEVSDLNFLNSKNAVTARQLTESVVTADVVSVLCENDISISELGNLLPRLQNQNVNKIYCIGNKILLKHLGSNLVFKITGISTITSKENHDSNYFHVITNQTKWKINNDKPEKKSRYSLNKLGGLDKIISELKDVISLALSEKKFFSGLPLIRGILIFGPRGTGKTTLIESLAEHFTHNIVRIESTRVASKFLGETEKELCNYFEKAKQISPSIILMDDLDVLCAKSNSNSEYHKRVTATLALLMDSLNTETEMKIVVLGTTSNVSDIDKMLRCPSRFGKEVEIHVPSSPERLEILNVLLLEIDHNLKEMDVKAIADSSHGFVGADLVSLAYKAVLRNYKTFQKSGKVSFIDFQWALCRVKPSAMKEIMIEVPNVKWTDIGGQDDLKLKLKQSVEWPLKYSESFSKLGITPPKGLLMFGPPGCSKTMIAKALATESKLNFISVKGPELFSKWVGESERAVRKVFRRARQTAPSIIFFDELDAIGGERNSSSGSNVQERVLAQLLTELDGVEPLNNVTVIAATNRLDRIDPALLRPGRLDRIVYVPLPDFKTRREILGLQLKKTFIDQDIDVEELINRTDGYSGAEIVALCREAALKALEENFEAHIVKRKHFLEAFEVVIPRTPKSLLEMYSKVLNN